MFGTDVPVDPDAPTAREWLRQVLSGAEYQRARPSLWELLGRWIMDRLSELQLPVVPGGPPLIVVAIPLLLIVGALVVAFVRYGVPRLNRKTVDTGRLFEEQDERTAARLRRDAAEAARSGDWPRAIAEQFRALSRALADRTVISLAPGTTAHRVARSAGAAFPPFAARLDTAASSFDDVRYLDGIGSREAFEALAALDRELQTARATLDPVLVGAAPR